MGRARQEKMSSALRGQCCKEESTTRRGGLVEDGKVQRAEESKTRSDERGKEGTALLGVERVERRGERCEEGRARQGGGENAAWRGARARRREREEGRARRGKFKYIFNIDHERKIPYRYNSNLAVLS